MFIVICALIIVAVIAGLYYNRSVTKREVNPYGDELRSVTEGFGSDVSSQRVSPFEEAMLERASAYAHSSHKQPVALDLFSGYCAANGRRLAEYGFDVYALDFSPPDASLESVVGRPFPSGGTLRYSQRDVRDLSGVPTQIDLVTAQRGLHFLRFNEARTLVSTLAQRLNSGGSMFLSIGATDCKVGDGYKHTDLPVEQRWHPLEPEFGEPIHVTEPLCLYKEEDIKSLFANLGGELVYLDRDDFGLFIVEFKKH